MDAGLGEVAIETNLKQFLLVLSISLSVATLPRIFSWFRQIPYTLLLVIVGLGLAFVDIRLVELSPQLILSIFLPPLLFEAAWNLRWQELKQELLPVCLYAVIGVIIAIAGIALGLNQLAGVSLATALLIGASLSATDPVSVIALFRELGVSSRLNALVEGESLFNDGMAVVAFGFLVALPLGTADLSIQSALLEFVRVIGVGIAVGSLIGFGISYLTQRFDLPLVEQSLTLVSAFGTYFITEDLGGSGVIGVVATGLILGNFGSRIGMNPRTRIIVSEFWEFLAFFVNSIVFLLIGTQVRFNVLSQNLGIIAIALMAMLGFRAISIFCLSAFSNQLSEQPISLKEQTVVWWGGLRGSVSIALALSVPAILPDREEIIATVFGVVLFTLLVQGLTIKPLLDRLNLLGDQSLRQQFSAAIARLTALKRVLQYLGQSADRPAIEPEFYQYQASLIKGEIARLEEEVETLRNEYPDLRTFATEQFTLELLSVEADTYAEFVRAGQLNRELAPFLQQNVPAAKESGSV
ncbi:sodium:proton antiporter (plasmid) [Kovacikia minuta CCNUW1]|uniref:cation:proton antiporter n=1 Tax=Kovacikia minuta TaxID=2931930 RepID=UPI001CCAF8B0|nr:sodium:proton antiporter [Kovacikia minuta]UBF30588.1 sodium:proton antiporter [Kovacikia minuta CCNUW1]